MVSDVVVGDDDGELLSVGAVLVGDEHLRHSNGRVAPRGALVVAELHAPLVTL